MPGRNRRVAVIGLDCATPELMFDEYAADMPTLGKLLGNSLWGPLRSTIPPITVPAWSCMYSGRTPGELGIYGFRNRVDHSYEKLSVATSSHVRVPRLWDLLDAHGRESVLLGVPGTYPPPKIRGRVVGDFLTPSTRAHWTSPRDLAAEVLAAAGGEYLLDVADFRTDDKARVAQQIFDMTEQRFRVARHLATSSPWDLFAMVDMGPDRLHHGFWSRCRPDHPRHEPGGPYASLFRDYYRALDAHLAGLLEVLEDAAVLVVSDHGAQPMIGGFRINDWLVREGLLVLRHDLAEPTGVDRAPIDWSRTTAWADGGYYARVFLNVAGREPGGIVAPGEYEDVRDRLAAALEALPDHTGRPMGTRALRPEQVYPETAGIAPDLLVYLGDLRWRSVGTIGGSDSLYTFENDTGPDDANHAEYGIFALSGDGLPTGERAGLSLYDVAPTLQEVLGLPAPPGQRGRILT